jgi:hypothetical protein
MMNPSCAQNPYIPLIARWIQAHPQMVFTKLMNSGSMGVRRQVGLAQCWKVFSPLDGTFRAKLSVMFKGRLLHSMVHRDEHVTDCNHSIIQRGGEFDDNPLQTGYNNRQTLPHSGSSLAVVSNLDDWPAPWRWREDGRQSEVVLKGDLGWIVGEQRLGIDRHGSVS